MPESLNVFLNSLPAADIVPIFRDGGFDAEPFVVLRKRKAAKTAKKASRKK